MRVIAGRFRSRKLKSVAGRDVRPTPDRLREALFSVLAPRIEGSIFVDAYAGSGAVGIEALSRGAGRVIFLERNARALTVIRENLDSLGIRAEAKLMRGRAPDLLREQTADIVFIDPPYEQVTEYRDALLAAAETICPLAIAQHPSRLNLDEQYGSLYKKRVLRQGDNALSFFERGQSG
jgi:16S rRNA (guanine966-N2)-methyltransferase